MMHLCSLLPYSLTTSVDMASLFSTYKQNFGKSYTTIDAEAKAFSAFMHNDQIIKETNAKGLSYTLGHNEHSDKTWEEFFTGGYVAPTAELKGVRSVHTVNTSVAVASSVDWVSSGAVTAVKNQGSCGSCWAFSSTGAIEGAYYIASGSLLDLSEEDLVQCDTTCNGCGGGSMDYAFSWVSQYGLATESAYGYTSSSGTAGSCSSSKRDSPVVTVSGHTDVSSEDDLVSAVAQQPVSVAIEADKSAFQLYSSGVFDSTACGTQIDHGVLAVGYGVDADSGKQYWKVKNSWGSSWGESGFIRIKRGSNMCGIATSPVYPTGAQAYSSSASVVTEAARESELVEEDEVNSKA